MKLLFCIDRYQPSRGGAEAYLRDLAAALHLCGHHISIAALEAEPDGVSELIRIRAPAFPRLMREIVFARKVRRLHRSRAFDRTLGFRHVLETDLFQPHEGLFMDSIRGSIRPCSPQPWIRRLLFFRKWLSPKNLFFLYADRALFRNSPGLKVAALSHALAARVESRHCGFHPSITVIPNGVDTTRFFPEPDPRKRALLRRKLNLPEEGRLILFVAHNFRLKGLGQALEAVADYYMADRQGNDPLLLVVGRGRTTPYRKLGKALGMEKRVLFRGEQDDMRSLYAASDLLLHPTFYDPCSLVVVEALGAGLPVITSRYNGAAELLEGSEAGRIIDDPRDIPAISRAIFDILDSDQYETIREEAARLGARNSFENHLRLMEAWITSA